MFRPSTKSGEGRRNQRPDSHLRPRLGRSTRASSSKASPSRLVRALLLPFGTAALSTVMLATLSTTFAQDDPLNVVATVGMVADLAAEIGGECVTVVALMGPGVDPHLYQATSGDVRDLGRAELILYVGLSLEGQLGEVLDRFGRRTPTVAVGEDAIPPAELIRTSDAYGVDPHVWMDVSLWARIVPGIREAMLDALRGARDDAANLAACQQGMDLRAERVAQELDALHDWVVRATSTIPEHQRILVTAHDAFTYYGRAYGLDVIGIQGVSTESEAGVADIRSTAATIRDAGVPAVFIETTINPRTIQAVLDAAADLGHEARLGGSLYSDAMGQPGTPDGTYVGMLRANTVAIVEALGGQPPELPEALSDWADRHGLGLGQP